MSTFYLDFINGSDANNGSSWALAWKTITSGATAARIAPGDIIRIAKSPAPSSIGNGTWTGTSVKGGGFPATVSITSSTDATPIVVTKNAHGYVNGDIIQVYGHTTNVTANGVWKVANKTANTLELEGSSGAGAGAGAATGTMQLITSKIVQLASAQTKNICACEKIWTAGGTGDTTPTVGAGGKEGYGYAILTVDASPQTNKLQAYFAIPSTNFSSYQKISFWFLNQNAIADATTWKICLCSDNAGATPVDTFYISAVSTAGYWFPLTLTKSGGGNLGNAIQSIAVYSDATAPTASKYIYLDNIIACTTSGLNMQSLTSKSSLEQGGSEGWYAIQSVSVDGKLIALDNGPDTIANAGRGYSGTTETITTYIRETIKIAGGSGDLQDSGTAGNLIQYQGGYNTTTTIQEGETFMDGLNGAGNGIYASSKSYNLLNYLNTYRYYSGIYFSSSNYNTFTTISNINNNTYFSFFLYASTNNTITTISNINNNPYGMYFNNSNYNSLMTISNANSNTNYGIIFDNSSYNTIGTISNANNNTYYGVYFYTGNYNTITAISNANNNSYNIYFNPGNYNAIKTISNANDGSNYGVYFNVSRGNLINTISNANNTGNMCIYFSNSCDNIIRSVSITGSASAAVYSTSLSNNYIRNALLVGTEFTWAGTMNKVYSWKHDQTANNDWIFMDGGTINKQSATTQSGSGYAWQFTTSSSTRDSYYPLVIKLAEIPVVANLPITVTAYMKKDHATNVACKLRCQGGQLSGVPSNIEDVKANDTNWEQLTLTFTPTETGIIEIEALAWYVSGNSNCYVDTFSVV